MGKALAQKLDLAFIELDAINHLPNWQPCDPDIFRHSVAQQTSADRWVIDGNYSQVNDIVLPNADTVIWLDYTLAVTFGRVLRRTIQRAVKREVLWNGNRESVWRTLLTRDSILLWVLQTHRRRSKQADVFFADPNCGDQVRMRFRHPQETDVWLSSI